MRKLLALMLIAAATPAAADCQQKVHIEVVPNVHVVGVRDFDMRGRPASMPAIQLAAPDVVQASMNWRGWKNDRDLSFAVAWPEAPTLRGSLAGKPRWWINLGRFEHVAGKYIAVTAVGSRGTWRDRWTLTQDHAIFVGPSPRNFSSVTMALHNADGAVEAKRSFTLPDWKSFASKLPAVQKQLQHDLEAKASLCLHPPAVPPPPAR